MPAVASASALGGPGGTGTRWVCVSKGASRTIAVTPTTSRPSSSSSSALRDAVLLSCAP
jgi:hypothetical protein